ncbi:MAG TPA: hypothetical protein VIG90_03240 [Pedomonas sp.]|uniref:hypothetical protein n=1 Tax=Pedomonas sp. TaxID=2976421 RepID=UPI002F41FB13
MPKVTVNRRLPIAGQSPGEDRLLAIAAALASELAVTRERLDTLERLCQAAGVIKPDAIEQFTPDPEQTKERDGLRKGIISRVFRPLLKDTASQ